MGRQESVDVEAIGWWRSTQSVPNLHSGHPGAGKKSGTYSAYILGVMLRYRRHREIIQ
jgi:hypothetical protein